MGKRSRQRRNAIAASVIGSILLVLVALSALSFLDGTIFLPYPYAGSDADRPTMRRGLLSREDNDASSSSGVYRWAQHKALTLDVTPDPQREVVLFWNVPKSGGTTAKDLYRCMERNVEIKSRINEIQKSQKVGLVRSGQVDVIFSSAPDLAVDYLFDEKRKARVVAMFRHPVDRLISKFYYLQEATWENTYRPEWKGMDILEWVKHHNNDNDHMVKKLAGKALSDEATRTDLVRAKKTVKSRFVVGLVEHLKESFQRFNVVMGINYHTNKNYVRCMRRYFGKEDTKKKNNDNVRRKNVKRNESFHPKTVEGSPEWNLLAEQNAMDIQLFEYARTIYAEQSRALKSYGDLAVAGLASE